MTDLWPSFLPDDTTEESNAVELLEEQAKLLGEKTGDKVKAKLFEVTYNEPIMSVMETFGQTVGQIIGPKKPVEAPDVELEDKTDINRLYKFTNYHFEIYNDIYHFRVFTLKNRVVFPIQIMIDEGIWEELSFPLQKQPLDIESNAELEDVVRQVFDSKKLKSIIHRLMNSNNGTSV